MSNNAFAELNSADPVERGIARRVLRILNDTSLDRARRERLVRRAQQDLIGHRAQTAARSALIAAAQGLALPKGFKAVSVQAQGGLMQVGAICKRQGFAWFEAGEMPTHLGRNLAAMHLPPVNSKKQGRGRTAAHAA
jgi:hypothetical protein